MNSTLFPSPSPMNLDGSIDGFAALVAFVAFGLLCLVIFALKLFDAFPEDGLCCLLCGKIFRDCYKCCCKRAKKYQQKLDTLTRDLKKQAHGSLIDEASDESE